MPSTGWSKVALLFGLVGLATIAIGLFVKYTTPDLAAILLVYAGIILMVVATIVYLVSPRKP